LGFKTPRQFNLDFINRKKFIKEVNTTFYSLSLA